MNTRARARLVMAFKITRFDSSSRPSSATFIVTFLISFFFLFLFFFFGLIVIFLLRFERFLRLRVDFYFFRGDLDRFRRSDVKLHARAVAFASG